LTTSEVTMARSLSVAEAKRRFSDVLGTVRHRGERVIVERRGRPVAAIVPLDDLARLEGDTGPGVLALVGAFGDARDLPRILDDVVQARAGQRRHPAPRLRRR
jgi:prevent-host-death family protein